MSANTIQVVVPEGVSEGQVFVVQLSNGQTLSVTCPRGAYPGTTLSVTGGQSLFARAFREDSSESKNSTETKYHHREDIVTWIDSRSYGSPYDERVYTWNRIPDSEAEFRAAKRLLCRTPQGAACLLSMATLIYCNPRTTKLGEICMRLSIHPDVNFSRALRDFSSRMKSDPSIAASYIQGTRPGNRYALPSTLTCKIRTQHVDVRAGRHKVFVYSTGADTPRPITMKATASGEFLAKEFSSLMVEVCPSGIFRHFKEKRSKDVLRRIATVQVDRFMNELIACSSLSSSDVERRIRPLLHSTVSWRHQSYVVVVVLYDHHHISLSLFTSIYSPQTCPTFGQQIRHPKSFEKCFTVRNKSHCRDTFRSRIALSTSNIGCQKRRYIGPRYESSTLGCKKARRRWSSCSVAFIFPNQWQCTLFD